MFDAQDVVVKEQVEARTTKIEAEEAWILLAQAKEIVVGRGKKYTVFSPEKDDKEELLRQCLGRSGTLRAPALRIGDRYIVGFSEPMYAAYLTP